MAKKKTAKKKATRGGRAAKRKRASSRATKKSTGKRTAKQRATSKRGSKRGANKTAAKKAVKKRAGKKATKQRTAKKKAAKKKTPKQKSAKKATAKQKASSRKATKKSAAAAKTSPARKASKPSARKDPYQAASGAVRSDPTVLESPGYKGKPSKLERETYPEQASAVDFQCFGPPAMNDGQFDGVRICDMGCFTQDGKDSNKYYHGAVVQHRDSKNWYTYFEWGRTGAQSRSFQFVACQSEPDARATFVKQLLTKNEKRGQWVTIAGIRTLRAKKGKDCYLVRPMATRSTGLPDARNIKSNQRLTTFTVGSQPSAPCGDRQTLKLLSDLRIATIAYTRKSMADASIPTQVAVDQARTILGEAATRVAEIDEDVEAQIADKSLMELTQLMFSRIPRKKKVGSPPAAWMLTSENIQEWNDDLDAFESALHAVDIELNPQVNILAEMNIQMNWIDPKTKVGKFLYQWAPKASVKQHENINRMEIINAWEVEQHGAGKAIASGQRRILRSRFKVSEKPRHQPRSRVDLSRDESSNFKKTNTAFLFHGTRSVNVNAILRESLRMPETLVAVPITGAKFGPGIYFTDDWKKAADYTNTDGSMEVGGKGAVKGRHAFMFVADVVLGRPFIPPSVQGYSEPPRGHHSVFGKADHSGVDDNEFVVYKTDQHRLRYLLEFKTA